MIIYQYCHNRMDINDDQSQYDLASSQEIIVEFGQLNRDLVGSVIADSTVTGEFGTAQIHLNKGDKLVLLDPTNNQLRVVSKIYRGIVIKSNKKKQSKIQTVKNQQKNVQQQQSEKSSQNLFESSDSSREQPKKRKKKPAKPASELTGKTRIIRKIRTLSKKAVK